MATKKGSKKPEVKKPVKSKKATKVAKEKSYTDSVGRKYVGDRKWQPPKKNAKY